MTIDPHPDRGCELRTSRLDLIGSIGHITGYRELKEVKNWDGMGIASYRAFPDMGLLQIVDRKREKREG